MSASTRNTERWREAKRILAIRLDAMGDVLMTTPALRAIKETSGATIALLTSTAGAAIATHIPEVNEVLTFDAPWMPAKGNTDLSTERSRLQHLISLIDEHGFDATIIFTVFTQNPLPAAMAAYLAGIRLRAAHSRENPYSVLTNWVEDVDQTVPIGMVRHEVRRQLDLVRELGFEADDERLSIRCSAGAITHVEELLDRHRIGSGARWVTMHTGAMAESRRYAPEKFLAAARSLEQSGIRVLLTGSDGDKATTASIACGSGAIDLAGALTLDELIALIAKAPLLVSNNSGPVHIAAAVGTPVVDLYALTNPQHTPWHVPNLVLSHDVECRYCFKSVCPKGHHQCLEAIEPETVVEAAQILLNDTRTLPVAHPRHSHPSSHV